MNDTLFNEKTPDQLKDESGSSAPDCSAFPVDEEWDDGIQRRQFRTGGMTLRDYFAAKAMAAMMSQPESAHDWTDEKVAEWAYNAADAMLIRRQNDQGHRPDDGNTQPY